MTGNTPADRRTPTVTVPRVAELLERDFDLQFRTNSAGTQLYAYINGVPVWFDGQNLPRALTITASLMEFPFPMTYYADILQWLTSTEKHAPVCCYVTGDPSQSSVLISVDAPIIVEAGLSEPQLRDTVAFFLTEILREVMRCAQYFQIGVPGLTDTDWDHGE